MPTEARILETDRCVDRSPKRCTNCEKWKARDEFPRSRNRPDKLDVWCAQCRRIAAYTHYHEGGGKAVKAAYGLRPEVKAARAADESRREQRRAYRAAYWRTAKGKLVQARSKARRELRQAVTDERRSRAEAKIAACDREFARLDREHELPAEPPGRAVRGLASPFKGVYRNRNGTYKVKVSIGGGEVRNGGTYTTADEARDAANALAFRLIGVRNYAVPRAEARYATRRDKACAGPR